MDPAFSSAAFERRIKDRATTVRLSPVAAQLQVSAPARLGRRVLPIGVREPLFKSVREMLSPAPAELSREPASPEPRARVAEFFREDAARFRELTGTALSPLVGLTQRPRRTRSIASSLHSWVRMMR